MNLSSIFIRRPIMTTLVMAALLLFGVVSYKALPVSDLPNVDFPTIQVSATLPGANPETMASAVATPLERQFTTIPGIDSITSSSNQNTTQITLQFKLERDIDAAAQDVQTALAAVRLPSGMPNPPSFRKVNPAEQPILYLSLNSPTLPLSQVDEYAQTLVAQRLSTISGVAQIQVYGSQKYAVRAQLDPNALASRGIGIDEVAGAIQQGNSNGPTGTLNGANRSLTIQTNGQLTNADAYRQLIVAYRNGSPVRLQELGHVIDSVENVRQASWYNNTRGVVLAVQRQPGANTVAVVDGIQQLLPTIRAQLPASVNLETVFNRSETIRASVHDVQFTLVLTTGLVILVIFLFLRNLSATLIPSLALPTSIIASFAIMHLMGFNLDNLSLMALTLATGFVVDDAIVMLENIVRRMEHGEGRMEAALNGAREIGFTILAMTISLVAVFIPVLFMGGIVGRLFNEFAVTISAAILVSGFVSLSLTPMLGSRFLRNPATERHGRFYRALEAVFEGALALYDKGLRQVLKHRRVTLAASLVLLVFTGYLFTAVPKGFIPTEDINRLMGTTEGPQGISFDDMKVHQQHLAQIVMKDPNVAGVMSSVGAGGPNASANRGRLFIRLKPRAERKLSSEEVITELRPKLSKIPGIRVFLVNPPSIRIGGQQTKSLYQLTLSGTNLDELYRGTQVLEEKMRDIPELTDVTSDLEVRNPQVTVEIDRDQASALGVTTSQIEQALANAYGNRQISQIYAPTNQYNVILEVLPEYQTDPSALASLYVRSGTGKLVPLGAVAKLTPGVGPVAITHLGQMPSTTISFNLKPGVSLSQATEKVQAVSQTALPEGITSSFQGSAQVFQSSMSNMGWLLLLAIVVIYIVLGILYESFIHPLTVLSGLPSAGMGALLTLMVFQKDLDIYGFVGLIMLIGIVKKNAIMLIDFALEAQKSQGLSPQEAIYEACRVRFRPIMMTTFAALAGALPIALGLGAGAEARQPLGLAVFGGLLVSQLLTLFITPVMYVYLDKLQHRLSRKPARKAKALEGAGAPSSV
ncbi:MAG TPA: efflux RND transporter permease subunit [Stenomitos sp.]